MRVCQPFTCLAAPKRRAVATSIAAVSRRIRRERGDRQTIDLQRPQKCLRHVCPCRMRERPRRRASRMTRRSASACATHAANDAARIRPPASGRRTSVVGGSAESGRGRLRIAAAAPRRWSAGRWSWTRILRAGDVGASCPSRAERRRGRASAAARRAGRAAAATSRAGGRMRRRNRAPPRPIDRPRGRARSPSGPDAGACGSRARIVVPTKTSAEDPAGGGGAPSRRDRRRRRRPRGRSFSAGCPAADRHDRLGSQRLAKRVRLVGEHALRVPALDLDDGGGLVVVDGRGAS